MPERQARSDLLPNDMVSSSVGGSCEPMRSDDRLNAVARPELEPPEADPGDKQARWQFRKAAKARKRRSQRQAAAQARVQRHQAQQQQREADAARHAKVYEQQKAQWEAKEREFNAINAARKVAREVEKRARDEAMTKFVLSLQRLHTDPPAGYASQAPPMTSSTFKQRGSVLKQFEAQDADHKRQTYRQRHTLKKKQLQQQKHTDKDTPAS
ncbi:hypothetical protein BC940DRAFT_346465 [Gongronella butleri]|nr:hypothetical protein BC940DRAFT_346465 [Gongronella butleri]